MMQEQISSRLLMYCGIELKKIIFIDMHYSSVYGCTVQLSQSYTYSMPNHWEVQVVLS